MKTGHQGRVQAIDVSENMLNKAQANINKYALANIDLHSMDTEALEFRSNYFDVLTASFVLFFLADPAQAIQKVLKFSHPCARH